MIDLLVQSEKMNISRDHKEYVAARAGFLTTLLASHFIRK